MKLLFNAHFIPWTCTWATHIFVTGSWKILYVENLKEHHSSVPLWRINVFTVPRTIFTHSASPTAGELFCNEKLLAAGPRSRVRCPHLLLQCVTKFVTMVLSLVCTKPCLDTKGIESTCLLLIIVFCSHPVERHLENAVPETWCPGEGECDTQKSGKGATNAQIERAYMATVPQSEATFRKSSTLTPHLHANLN